MGKLSQGGFGIIAPLLVLFIVGVIGFASVRIYENRGDPETAPGTSQNSDQATSETSPDIETAVKSLDDPSLDSGVDDGQLDKDLDSLL